jgi:Fe-S cluster biogenesis protein NfuA
VTPLQSPATQKQPSSGSSPTAGDGSLADRVRRVIELIRPAVQADGGDIEFIGVTPDNTVQIRMHGACVGCPSSTVTLQTGIERNLKAHIPEIRGLEAVE